MRPGQVHHAQGQAAAPRGTGGSPPPTAAPRIETALTRLLGLETPILCGGLMWLATADYVAAVVNAGAMGFITPRSYPDLDAFREALRRCRRLTGGRRFGVNLYISARPEQNAALDDYVGVMAEEGVDIAETAGRSPAALMPRLREFGCTVIHKVTTVRHAVSAERAGVDAVVLLGAECGGHPGRNTVPGALQAALARPRLRVPLVLGGGIGSGAQIAAALAQGCDGVLIGTRMLVADEIPAHRAYKEHLLTLGPEATRTVLHHVDNVYRCLDNRTARALAELEAQGITDYAVLRRHVGGHLQRQAYATGDAETGILSLGPAVALCDRIEPAAAILGRLSAEAAAHLAATPRGTSAARAAE